MQILELTWIGWIAVSTVACWMLPARWRPWCIAAFALAFVVSRDPPSAIILAMMSVLPPAVKPTTIVIGRLG